MPKYIKGVSGPGKSVIYTDADGKSWKFEGGGRPWRNQNPGNLVQGEVSKRYGSIGSAGGFAIFPNYEAGHRALLDSLKIIHGNKDIPALMNVFAPPKENDTKKYILFLLKKTGVKRDKKIKDFSEKEFEKLWQGIEKMEGWGQEGKITGIKKDKKGTIQFYEITGYGKVSKAEGIALALKGKIDAVVVKSTRGNKFLRARPNSNKLDNLENLG